MPTTPPTILLVHGGFVDGSDWIEVCNSIRVGNRDVLVVQNATGFRDADAAAVTAMTDAVDHPVVMVGYSYGGGVIAEAGSHSGVVALVHVSASSRNAGEMAPTSPIKTARPAFVMLKQHEFPAVVAADIHARLAAFVAGSRTYGTVRTMGGKTDPPGWRSKPSWYLVSTDGMMIQSDAHPMAERAGATIIEGPDSHPACISPAGHGANSIPNAASDG